MKELILNAWDSIVDLVISVGPIGGIMIVIIESLFPILPLSLFITINITAFGMVTGFIISWISTVLGASLAFYVVRKGFGERLHKKVEDKEKLNDLINWISTVKISHLTILVALPFTPSFLVNIAGGLSKISIKRFALAMLIGKPFMVYFWAYIGYNLIEVFNNPRVLLEIILMLVVAYLVSKYIDDKLDID